ncbi:MAG: hypothetical protein FWC34_00910 [Bacteroidetes bacterium]|nr:hypothetical protein [Bacteroidota bacterium]
MTEDIFYQYDFYTLEQRCEENKIVKILDNSVLLSNAVEPFMQNVANSLFTSIKENKNIEISKITLPEIENDLQNALTGNRLYDVYFESNPENKLSEIVCKKFLNRMFKKDGFNNEEYTIQRYVHAWLEKKLAQQIAKDLHFNSTDTLARLIRKTEMLHRFYISLVENIPQNWIKSNKKDWISVNACPENIMDSIRTSDRNYINNYTDFYNSIDKTNLWDYVCKATRNSDYASLNDEFSFRSSVLIKNDISLWIEFWDNLNLPIIQDCALHSYFNITAKQYLEIIDVLITKKIEVKSDINVLLLIVAKNYFEKSYKLTERLSFYEDEDRINTEKKHFFNNGKKFYKEWLKEKPKHYEKLIKELQLQLPQFDIEDWIFSYKPIINNNAYKANNIYNSEIELLTRAYKSDLTKLADFNSQRFNLQKFNYYVQIIRDSENKDLAVKLLNAMLDYITSDKFFWDKSYFEPYWSSIKGVGYLIGLHADPIQKAKKIIDKFKVNHQGWNPVKIDYKPTTREAFVYSGITLLFEHATAFKDISSKKDFFQDFLKTILTQDRYSQIDNSEYYQRPLRLLFLVSNQVFSEVKKYFEKELIENCDNLYSLLSILSSDNKAICNQSKLLLEDKLEKEFSIEKRQFSNQGQKDKIQEMEKMIDRLKINCL